MLLVVRETFTNKIVDWFDTDYNTIIVPSFCGDGNLGADLIKKAYTLAATMNLNASMMESDLAYIVETYTNREKFMESNNASC